MSTVDVAVNIFAKPYQTSLSLLSLLKFSGQHVDRIYLQFEPSGSKYDKVFPYVIAEYLETRAIVYQPEYWLKLEAADTTRFTDTKYRLSVRYQHAFENTDKEFLFIMHNDVLIKKDIIGHMRENIGNAFVMGQVGQCWNCPAANQKLVQSCGLGDQACSPERYPSFKPSLDRLQYLYEQAEKQGVFVRPYYKHLADHYSGTAWPLPECRVNEWAAMVNVKQTEQFVVPQGGILPFGCFEQCGPICLDTAVAWFRDLSRLGLQAKHMDIAPYVTHWVGNGKMTESKYLRAEENARVLLEKHFPDFVTWCRTKKNKMFV